MASKVPTFRPRYLPTLAQQRRQYDRTRVNDEWRAFINSRAWRRCSKSYLASHPLCERCLKDDRPIPAREVHHLHGQDPEFAFDHAALEALCTECHSRETMLMIKSKQTSANKITNVDE
jgi:hypothetical protein